MTSQYSGLNVIGKEKTQSVLIPRTGLAASMVILTARVDDPAASKAFCCPDCADPSLGFAFYSFQIASLAFEGEQLGCRSPFCVCGPSSALFSSPHLPVLFVIIRSYLSRSPDSPKLLICFFVFPSITLLRSNCIVNVTYLKCRLS